MNSLIEKLLLQIAYVCLHITSQGKWHAHYTISAHTRGVTVEILPADTNYGGPKGSPRALNRVCYYQNCPGFMQHDETELTARAIEQLDALLNDLNPFLNIEQLQAAIDDTPPLETVLLDESLAAVKRLVLEGGIAELQLDTGPLSHSALLTVDKIDHPAGYSLEATLAIHKQRHTLALCPTDGIYTQRLCEWIEATAHGRLASAA